MKYIQVVSDHNKKRMIKQKCKENTFIEYKILGYQEFLKKFYFDYNEKTIYYVVENYNTTREIAEIYLKNLYLLRETEEENEKIEFLNQLYQDLKKQHLLIENPLWKEQLKKRKVVFYHISKPDLYFQHVVNDLKKITQVEIIEENLNQKKQDVVLTEYENTEQEVIGVINEICHWIKKGVSISKIFLTNLNEEYRSLLRRYSMIFQLPMALKEEKSLLSNEIIHAFFSSTKPIEEILEKLKKIYNTPEEQEIIKKLVHVGNQYTFIKDPKKKKEWMKEKLKTAEQNSFNHEFQIQEISFLEEEIDHSSILFVLGVKEGNFPIYKKDEEYLKENELTLLKWETTKEQNELQKKCYEKKLKTFSNLFLSFPKQDGTITNQIASILKKIPLKEKKKEEWNHSHLYNQLMLASKMDFFYQYKTKEKDYDLLKTNYPELPYLSYDNKWKTFHLDQTIKLSYSKMDTFFRCPFRYYLTYLLKIQKEEDNFDLLVGNLCHAILKESQDETFDLETSFLKLTNEMQIQSKREYFFLKQRKEDLKRILKTIKKQEKETNFEVLTEEKISITIDDILINGILDKIYFKKEDHKTFVSVVDYKTGNQEASFDHLIYGMNFQLPLYLVLLKQLPFEKIKIIGLYLQKIIPDIPKHDNIHTEEELKEKKLMLQGYSIEEEATLKKFDPTYENSKRISGLKMSSKGFYSYSKVLSEEEFEKIEKITITKIKEAIKKIKKDMFEIEPIQIGATLTGCEHCKYQEICFRKESDIKNEKEMKLKEMLGSD